MSERKSVNLNREKKNRKRRRKKKRAQDCGTASKNPTNM